MPDKVSMATNEYQTPNRSTTLRKPPLLRVINWFTLVALTIFLYGILASKYGFSSAKLDTILQKGIADIDSLTLSLSLFGFLWNIIDIKQNKISYWKVLTLIPFWSLLIYLGSRFF